MKKVRKETRSVPSQYYTKEYFLQDCGDYEIFQTSWGNDLSPRLKRIIQLLEPRMEERILDVGSGRGELVKNLTRIGVKAIGIDYSKDAIEISKKYSSDDEKYLLGTVSSLPFKNEIFDGVIMADIIEHLYPEETFTALNEINRCLKKGGKIIIHTNNKSSVIYDKFYFGKKLEENSYIKNMHVNYFTAKSLKKILKETGFDAKIWTEGIGIPFPIPIYFACDMISKAWLKLVNKFHLNRELFAIARKG